MNVRRLRLAVVTGATGGIGFEICRQLAERGIGLVLVDRDRTKALERARTIDGGNGRMVQGAYAVDLASHADVARAAGELRSAFPRIDYLFNNAGVLTETLQFSGAGNELHFEVNTLAPLGLIDGLRASLAAAGGAVVVNTSAGISLQVKTLDIDELVRPATFSKLFGPYNRSKAALNVLTAALAPELGADGIRIRAVDPGPTRTRLTKGAGTPLWMRVFYPFLPSPASAAKTIVDAALATRWSDTTGAFITGGKVRPLPPALADPAFQTAFLAACRARVADETGIDRTA